jgi:hypothetical protein
MLDPTRHFAKKSLSTVFLILLIELTMFNKNMHMAETQTLKMNMNRKLASQTIKNMDG